MTREVLYIYIYTRYINSKCDKRDLSSTGHLHMVRRYRTRGGQGSHDEVPGVHEALVAAGGFVRELDLDSIVRVLRATIG